MKVGQIGGKNCLMKKNRPRIKRKVEYKRGDYFCVNRVVEVKSTKDNLETNKWMPRRRLKKDN